MTAAEAARKQFVQRVQHAGHSCEALGVCQHTEQECPGACRQTPALPVQFAGDEPDDDYDPGTALLLFIERALLACTIGVTLGALYGAARWVGWAP